MSGRGRGTTRQAALGDGSVSVRVAGTDLVIFRMDGATGRPQVGHLDRQVTGETTYDPTTGLYTPTGLTPPAFVQGAAILVELPDGRAPTSRRVVSIAQAGV
jgi:hypothetical protein